VSAEYRIVQRPSCRNISDPEHEVRVTRGTIRRGARRAIDVRQCARRAGSPGNDRRQFQDAFVSGLTALGIRPANDARPSWGRAVRAEPVPGLRNTDGALADVRRQDGKPGNAEQRREGMSFDTTRERRNGGAGDSILRAHRTEPARPEGAHNEGPEQDTQLGQNRARGGNVATNLLVLLSRRSPFD
jgi:hypothetical protein